MDKDIEALNLEIKKLQLEKELALLEAEKAKRLSGSINSPERLEVTDPITALSQERLNNAIAANAEKAGKVMSGAFKFLIGAGIFWGTLILIGIFSAFFSHS